MYTITGKIQGVAPILFNAPDLDMLKPSSGTRQKTEEQRDQESLKRAYIDETGLFIPAWNFKKNILEGFKMLDLRVPGSKMKRLWKFVQPVIFIERPLYFGIEKPDFINGTPPTCFLHKVPGKNADGSATIIRRPALTEWELPFTIKVLDDLVRAEDMQAAIICSGERIGLGGWRPEYGRFIVTEWATTIDAGWVAVTTKTA
jgi:hypothetical protein